MSPRGRKLALTAHVVSSVGWLGAVAVALALAVVGLTSQDAELVRSVYLVLEPIGWFALVPLSMASLVTGLIQSLGTRWGLLRHYWVLMKLAINVVASVVLLIYMPTLGSPADVATATSSGARPASLRSSSPVLHAGAALFLLLAAAVLSVTSPRAGHDMGGACSSGRARAIDLALHTCFPVTLLWGPEFVLIYNEAYVPLITDKHPTALGAPARDVFPEAWNTIGPMMAAVRAGAGPTWVEDASVPLERRGILREAYFTFSYSPVRGADGAIEGVLDIATETTRQVIDRRRLVVLSRLGELLGDLERSDDVRERALHLLRGNAEDLPDVEILLGGVPSAPPGGDGIVVELTGAGRVARFPLGSSQGGAQRPVLTVRLSDQLAPDEAYLGFLRLIASSLGQAIDRINAREAERRIADTERNMSTALQRSLLTEPLQPQNLEVAGRYLPAVEQAQVGGDWYDSFMGPDGSLAVVVGDVTGHDLRAVAAMAQVRNLMRGVSYSTQVSPARVLSALDQAMHGLSLGVYATAILAQVEQEADAERGSQTLRWSNAGHPPPVLIPPDGRARLLETPPDMLLGLGGGERTDHAVTLEPGAGIVFYTDGLVERSRIPLQDGLEWLVGVLHGRQGLSAEDLGDHLLAQCEDTVRDDVALLILRVHEREAPRPAAAASPVRS